MYKDNNTLEIKKQVDYYFECGLNPIPAFKHTKIPASGANWNRIPPRHQWGSYDRNVGFLLDGYTIAFDADNDSTAAFFHTIFDKYDPPITKTRTGKHFIFRTDWKEWNKTLYKFKNGLEGELRITRCMVLAPPSFVTADNYTDPSKGDWTYYLESGDYSNIPHIPLAEVEAIVETYCNVKFKIDDVVLPEEKLLTVDDVIEIPIPVIKRSWENNKIIKDKLKWLRTAEKNDSYENKKVRYKSRSEVIQSIMVVLVRYGYDPLEIETIFADYIGDTTLLRKMEYSYAHAVKWLNEKPLVQSLIQAYYQNFKTKSDMLVYRALVSLAYQYLRPKIYAKNAQLRKMTGIKHHQTITKALGRLCENGYLIKTNSDEYEIVADKNDVNKVTVYSNVIFVRDIYDHLNLQQIAGKHAWKVYDFFLTGEIATETEIGKEIGIDRRAVNRVLKKFESEGIVTCTKLDRAKLWKLTPQHQVRLMNLIEDRIAEVTDHIAADKARLDEYYAEVRMFYADLEQYGEAIARERMSERGYERLAQRLKIQEKNVKLKEDSKI